MARKPNYSFERQERDRQKAIKVAEKANAKREQRERDRAEAGDAASSREGPPPRVPRTCQGRGVRGQGPAAGPASWSAGAGEATDEGGTARAVPPPTLPKPAIPGGSAGRSELDGLKLTGGHLAAALIALEFEGDLLAFIQRTEVRPFNGGDVDEHVRAAVVRLDEAEALGGVEPLHSTSRHRSHLSGD